MLKNYILTALRNMKRYKVFTLINIVGLSIGLSMCMLVIMIVSYQVQSDRYNTRHDRIYRVTATHVNNTSPFNTYATVALPFANTLTEEFSGVKQSVRLRRGFGNSWVGDLDDPTLPVSGFFVDHNFLDLFELELQAGNPATALVEPFSVVLTEDAAIKIYGTKNALGMELDMDDRGLYKVTGVLADSENITHLSYEAVASMASAVSMEADSLLDSRLDSWGDVTGGWVYVELNEGTKKADVVSFMADVNEIQYGEDPDVNYAFGLQGITEIKPGPLMANEIGPVMPWFFVYILGGLGLVIMISSCFNYINLTIARSMNRSREVGVRKVSGASRAQVFGQFVVESVMLCLAAFLAAILLLLILEPAFSQLNFAQLLQWKLSYVWWVWASCLGFSVFIGLLAGLFPAITLSAFKPIDILGNLSQVKMFSRTFLRKSLIVVQFSLSLVFIISIMILYKQVDMMMNADLGFDNRGVLTLPYDEETYEPIRNEFNTQAEVVNITRSSHMPGTGNVHGATLKKSPGDEDESVNYFAVDEFYLENMGIPLLAGRNLSPRTIDQEESEVLINKSAVAYFGFASPIDAVGELVYTSDSSSLNIVGVIPDYHHEAMVMQIKPLALRNLPDSYNFIQVKVESSDLESSKTAIVDIWKKNSPGKTGRFMYLDALIKQFYGIMFGDLIQILIVVASIACLIACLGLLGITVFSTQLKVKEISIRKVLGARDMQLFNYLSKGFLMLIGISIILAVPLSWFVNKLWLEQMAYRISLSPWFFLVGSTLIATVAIVTIGFQILRVIKINPAVSLRNE